MNNMNDEKTEALDESIVEKTEDSKDGMFVNTSAKESVKRVPTSHCISLLLGLCVCFFVH